MEFTPRLAQILFLLLHATRPIAAGELAEQMAISRRTVFRELEHIDRTLAKFGLRMESVAQKGMTIEGSSESKAALLQKIRETESFDSRNKEERRRRLLAELLYQDEPRKSLFYSDLLQVSEGTVSADLASLEVWFAERGVRLVRKPGYGIYLEYEETAYRRAALHFLLRQEVAAEGDGRLLEKDVVRETRAILRALSDKKLLSITASSYDVLVLFLSIVATRIAFGKPICAEGEAPRNMVRDEDDILAERIAEKLAAAFGIAVPAAEIAEIGVYLKSRKLRYMEKAAPGAGVVGEYDADCIAYEMANAYDPQLAYELKQDDEFIACLAAHLKPTIVRLRHKIEIANPFLREIRAMHPEIYEKTRKAAAVLSEKLGYEIPEDEIGFLTLHFGAAAVRHDRKRLPGRKIGAGVVCASGIGISRLLFSRLRHTFEDRMRMTVLAQTELESKRLAGIDFLISTFPLETDKPVICVSPMLTETDVDRIAAMLDSIAAVAAEEEAPADDGALTERVDDLLLAGNEVQSILDGFVLRRVAADLPFSAVLRSAAGLAGTTAENAGQIYADLSRREAISTQVVPEFGLALLHSRTEGVAGSRCMILLPDGPRFTDAHFQGVEAVVVMLAAKSDSRPTSALAAVSTALFEDDAFLVAVKAGDEAEILRSIGMYVKRYFADYVRELAGRCT